MRRHWALGSRLWALGLVLWAASAQAQSLPPIRYTLSFPAPHTHYINVEATIPTSGRPEVELMMAVWTPGSYLVREYSRNVEGFAASGASGESLRFEKTRKNRWRVTTRGVPSVRLRYRVYAHEMSVRTNWVDDEFALLNGAPTYITLVESAVSRPHEVTLQLPPSWQRSFSGMTPGKSANSFVAPDYDTLVDSPILAGTPEVHEFAVSGKPHYLVDFRGRGVWKSAVAVAELEKVAQAIAEFWGHVPFERYYFFNIAGAPLNGLEHKNSTVINIPRESTDTREGLIDWLSTASHEYFHAWNVKRLRPIELGPFDYENEVYTKGLWFVEGLTDYYADLMLARARVVSRDEFLTLLSAQLRRLQTTPGRLEQSVEMASFDAWIKYYRPDENSANSSINYYVKGAVLGFVLDAKLRRMTAGERSLDEVMRQMYERFSGARGFTPDEVRAAVISAAGRAHAAEMGAWLERALASTDEVDYTDALQWHGLQLTSSSEPPRAWMGLVTRDEESRAVVAEVRRGSPAFAAGISVGDVIVDIGGQPLRGSLAAAVNRFRPGDAITVALSRHGRSMAVPVTLAADPSQAWILSVVATPTPEQARRLGEWLGGQ